MPPYSSLAVGNLFLDLADRDGVTPPTPMALIKLVYIAHGWYLALTGDPLIREDAEAWQYGPVIPSLYHRFKEYGGDPITSPATTSDGQPYAIDSGDNTARRVITKVWTGYGKYHALQLSALTHQKGTPWEKARKHLAQYHYAYRPIPNAEIREHYRKRLAGAA